MVGMRADEKKGIQDDLVWKRFIDFKGIGGIMI